jgi:ATP-dependent DNA helicase RecG
MRPPILNPLLCRAHDAPRCRTEAGEALSPPAGRDDAPRILDLLFHLPTGTIDRRARPKLRNVVPDTVVTVAVKVDRHRPPPPNRPRAPHQITQRRDRRPHRDLFQCAAGLSRKLLPVGERRYVSGTTALYDGMLQMVHPDRVVDKAGLAHLPLVEPVYPLTEGLSLNQLRKAAEAALAHVPVLPEWQDASFVTREKFPAFAEALRTLHYPAEPADVEPGGAGWTRLAYDELLAGQLALALVRAHLRRPAGRATPGTGALRKKLAVALPYSLTPSQIRAIGDIVTDSQNQAHVAPSPGRRGLGQDRGGAHGRARRDRGRPAGRADGADGNPRSPAHEDDSPARRRDRHQGRDPHRPRARPRTRRAARTAAGQRHPSPVGTHALFQEEVEFRDLALAIVDEQHRFGVHQRLRSPTKARPSTYW